MIERKLGWLGLADLLGQGMSEGAEVARRMHLAIADETFSVLEAIPVTRPVSRLVETAHHGIASLCYNAVSTAGDTLSALARQTLPETPRLEPVVEAMVEPQSSTV